MQQWKTIAAALAVGLAVAACGGGGAKVQSEVTTTTKGQQLLDLQKAYESGAISKSEYDQQREKVLDK